MKLAKLFTVGLVATTIASFANPAQVTGQEKSPAQKTETSEAPTQKSEATPETPKAWAGRTLVPGSEVSLTPVIQAEWIKGEAPEAFETGKVYIFECWSTKCGPCIGMIPHVNDLHKKYYDKGLRIYGMSVYENDKDECVEFVKEKGDEMSYPVAFTGKGGPFEREWMKPAGAKGIPHAFIVRNGKLLASTVASRLTNELVETMLDGDKGAEKAAAEILAAQIHEGKINKLLQNIKSARRAKDTETMTANIEKLKVIDPENAEIHTEELWVLIIKEEWPAAVTALNEMSASWAKESFVSMNSMRLARGSGRSYETDFEKALTHAYSEYVNSSEYIGPNHFACLSVLQWKIGEKESATATANSLIERAKAFSNGNEALVTPYERFSKSVNDGTMPPFSDLTKWKIEARKNPPAPKPTPETPETALRSFFKAMASQDLAALEKRCVTNPDLAILTAGEKLTKPQMRMMMTMAEEGPIKALEVGDSYHLPASGEKIAVDETMVNDNRKLLTMPGNPLPFPIVKVEDNWRVDAGSLITVRKAVAKLREKTDSQ